MTPPNEEKPIADKLDILDAIKDADENIRKLLTSSTCSDDMQTMESSKLHEYLKIVDPSMANRLHPNNKRKIMRWVAVQQSTKFYAILSQNIFKTVTDSQFWKNDFLSTFPHTRVPKINAENFFVFTFPFRKTCRDLPRFSLFKNKSFAAWCERLIRQLE